MGTISLRVGKDGSTVWQAEQVYGGLFSPGPDPAELRAWVADEAELGKRVADDFVSSGRCPAGTLDQHLFAVQHRRFPDPGDAPKRRSGMGRACLCQNHSHFLPLGPGNSGVHRGLPAGMPLSGLFWTAHITSDLPDPEAADDTAEPRRRSRSHRPQRTTTPRRARTADDARRTIDAVGTSQAYSQTYDSLIQDVQNLITLHPSTEGTRGRPAGDTGPLLRSAVVLLHTAWENYVKQVAIEGLDFLLGQIGSDHSKLHRALEQRLTAVKNPWALAGTAWQAEARNAVGQEVGLLNTPNIKKTEKLLDLAIGLPEALHHISWPNVGNAKVLANVDEFVHDVRGEIVHRGTTPGPLHKGGVNSWIKFFDDLASRLDKKIGTHLETETGARP